MADNAENLTAPKNGSATRKLTGCILSNDGWRPNGELNGSWPANGRTNEDGRYRYSGRTDGSTLSTWLGFTRWNWKASSWWPSAKKRGTFQNCLLRRHGVVATGSIREAQMDLVVTTVVEAVEAVEVTKVVRVLVLPDTNFWRTTCVTADDRVMNTNNRLKENFIFLPFDKLIYERLQMNCINSMKLCVFYTPSKLFVSRA